MKVRYGLLLACCMSFGVALAAETQVRAAERPSSQEESTFKWLRRRLPTFYEKRHTSVLSAYQDCVKQTRLATVTVRSRGSDVALGAIVKSDGYILTKASELNGELECRLADGRKLPAKMVGLHRQYDLAMLRVDATELPTVVWRDDEPAVGALVASTGQDDYPVTVGVVSVAARKIQSPSGVLGILLESAERGARIDRVISGSSAEEAGLLKNDVITSVNGQLIETRESLIQLIREFQPGDHVRLRFTRGESNMEIHATLGDPNALHGQTPLYVQNTLGGPISKRRTGFPRALQHDSVLEPNQCGGPVVDLDGRVVGLNIARAGRVASYAIPASDIRPMLSDMIAGRYAPYDGHAPEKIANASLAD